MLAECCESVRAQTVQPLEHLVGIDYARVGTTANMNRLAAAAKGNWLAVVADDDLILPHHLEALLQPANADIVYSEPRVEGEEWGLIGPVDVRAVADHAPTPPATCLIRTALWRKLGGYRGGRFADGIPEDHDLWVRAAKAGARIAYVPEVTWVYRFHGGNQSRRD